MKNHDEIERKKQEILDKLKEAAVGGNAEEFAPALAEAFTNFAASVEEKILDEYAVYSQSADAAVLAQRGVRVLTSAEREYYSKITDAMKSGAPMNALSGVDTTLPQTVLEEVFTDLRAAHPLLNEIDFRFTGPLAKIIVSSKPNAATWGVLTAAITAEIAASFTEIDLTLGFLSAFVPVSRAFLDLGPEWFDRYVRDLLSEALALGLENGIVDGDGNITPIGMTRDLAGAVTNGAYPRKTAIEVTALDPTTIGAILASLSALPGGGTRPVDKLLMVVNPADYFTKVFPATTVRTADGRFVENVIPYNTAVVQSAAVPAGYAIFGIANKYFAAVGNSQGGQIEYSDQYQFLQHNRVYAIFLYGNGRALDNNAFVYADISGLVPKPLDVFVTNAGDFPGPEA